MKAKFFKKYTYVSFDLFDTVFTRQYVRPVDLFADMEAVLSRESLEYNGFATVRQQSEFDIRKRSNFQNEVTLEEIYIEVGTRLGWNQQMRKRGLKAELHFEEKSLWANRKITELLPLLRKDGKQVVFITDTYLPEWFIRQILVDKSILTAGDRLFVSSDLGKMKAHGELFEFVLQALSPLEGDMIHVGDNYESDVLSAERYGIKGIHYTDVIKNRYETAADEDLLLSKIVATSKITRLYNANDDIRQGVIWDVTANVSAPLIFSFTCWCLQQALANKLKTVYFLSRDGQIMHALAQRIIHEYYEGQIEAKYLYVSRQALLFPALTSLDDEAFEWILAPTSLLTPRIVLNRINFLAEELSDELLQYGFSVSLDDHIVPEKRDRFRAMLMQLEVRILERAEVYRQRAHAYFRQEGLIRKDPFAVVDIGWSGTLQRSISRMLDIDEGGAPIYGYYFGLRNRKKHKFQDMLFSWFSDYSFPRSLDKETYIVPMTELFTAADHGGVVAYKEDEECMIPRLKSTSNATGLSWGVREQQEAMTVYCDNFLRMGLDATSLERVANAYLEYFEQQYRRFLLEPTYEEAKVYGSFPLAEDQNESYHLALAKKYSPRQLRALKKTGYRHHHNEWHEGAMKLTPVAFRKWFGFAEESRLKVNESFRDNDCNYFYLVSFPRSGNTWMVNSLNDYLNAQRAELLPSGYIGAEITLANGPQVKLAGVYTEGQPLGIKTHFHLSEFRSRDIPGGKIVYLLRDPRDVMVSYFFYLNSFLMKGVGQEIEYTNERFANHLRKFLPAYKGHVEGWLKEYNGSICMIRYEEMKRDYMATLKKEQSYLMLDQVMSLQKVKHKNVDNFNKIDKFTSVLQGNNNDFYRKGIVGDWENYFTEEHKDIVKEEVGELLIDFGYTDNLSW